MFFRQFLRSVFKIDMFCSGAQPKASAARSAHGTAMQKEEAASWQEAKQYSDRTGLTTKQKKLQ